MTNQELIANLDIDQKTGKISFEQWWAMVTGIEKLTADKVETETKDFLQAATMTRTEAGNRLAATRFTDEQQVLVEDVLIMYDQLVERLGRADQYESAIIQDARELEEVLRLGAKMRSAQKTYFRTRSSEALDGSRKLEREFDVAAAKKLDETPKKVPDLFS